MKLLLFIALCTTLLSCSGGDYRYRVKSVEYQNIANYTTDDIFYSGDTIHSNGSFWVILNIVSSPSSDRLRDYQLEIKDSVISIYDWDRLIWNGDVSKFPFLDSLLLIDNQ